MNNRAADVLDKLKQMSNPERLAVIEAATRLIREELTGQAPRVAREDPILCTWKRSFAKRLAPDAKTSVEGAVKTGYHIVLGRPPSAEELADSAAFVKAMVGQYQATCKADSHELALADFCQVLMMGLNEFVYVD